MIMDETAFCLRNMVLLVAIGTFSAKNDAGNLALAVQCSTAEVWGCKSCKAWTSEHGQHLFDVDCSNADLAIAPRNLSSSLGRLVLESNGIPELNRETFMNYPLLRTLRLSNNEIRFIANGTFSALAELRELHLNGNQIGAISEETFRGLRSLKFLDLRHNKIKRLADRAFSHLTSLTELHLDNNEINDIGNWAFVGLEDSLTTLSLQGNIIRTFQIKTLSTIRKFSIRSLDLGNNMIANIDSESISALHALRKLELDNNNLHKVPSKALAVIKGTLLELDLSDNHLSEISQNDFANLDTLTRLKLSSANVSIIYRGAFDRLPNLKELFLDGNPLLCDCRLAWLAQWLNTKQGIVYLNSSADTKCAHPKHLSGEEFLRVDPKLLVCTCAECVMGVKRCFKNDSIASCACNDSWEGESCSGICATGNITNTSCAFTLGECRCEKKCPRYSSLRNVSGVLHCKCLPGFARSGRGPCLDKDECAQNKNTCGQHSSCLNTQGSYKCVCEDGYTWVGGACKASSSEINKSLVIAGAVIVSAAVLAVVVCLVYYLLWRSRYHDDTEAASWPTASTRKDHHPDDDNSGEEDVQPENAEELQTLNPTQSNELPRV